MTASSGSGRGSGSRRRTAPTSTSRTAPSAKKAATAPRGSSRAERRWRPASRKGPVCGYTFDGKTCARRGAHHCTPRADKVVRFFAEVLVHTKGPWARKPFILDVWPEHDLVRPIFGEVWWSDEWQQYVRRYDLAYIVISRKNGKSEIVAGMVLYLLLADDEFGAEVYGAAKDTKQAGKVGEVVVR